MSTPPSSSRVQLGIDLDAPGRQAGELRVRWSDNRRPLGHYAVPLVSLCGGDGPTVLLTGGVHGDEFEGPAALMRLLKDLAPRQINGRLIVIPALNAPALAASSRVSPLDGVNLNRAFPGDPDGSATQMIAHYVESELLPRCDAAIDLHSGGKAAVFATCVLADIDAGNGLGEASLALARAFGAPYLWASGRLNDDRSLNAAARRQRVPMIAAELGGGGGCDPAQTDFAEAALRRCLDHLGLTDLAAEAPAGESELLRLGEVLTAPAGGLFDRRFEAGERVEAGQLAGWLHHVGEPERASGRIEFPVGGRVLARTNRGLLERGDLVASLAVPCEREDARA